MATLGLVWTLWPAPGARAYMLPDRIARSRYHIGPRVSIDLGHFNDSPSDSRFVGLAGLLTWDGYRVTRSRQYLVPEYLKDLNVLVIGNAMPYPPGFGRLAKAVSLDRRAVFGADEVEAVRDWVQAGGSLLLEAAAPGAADSAAPLAAALGLSFRECSAPVFLPAAEPGNHTILAGRAEFAEGVGRAAVLASGWIEAASAGITAVPLLSAQASTPTPCIAGKPVAVALAFGRGRVVALSAQLERSNDLVRQTAVDPRHLDNRQFVLNAMHWLSRAGD